jgi:hypothetical protein
LWAQNKFDPWFVCFSSDIDNSGTGNVKKENCEAIVNFMKTDAMTVGLS